VRRLFTLSAAGLIGALWLAMSPATVQSGTPKAGDQTTPSIGKIVTAGEENTCGTSVNFFKTPSEAAQQAGKTGKLVIVLHVSGNFEDPDFT
jgi:hypothetical protein